MKWTNNCSSLIVSFFALCMSAATTAQQAANFTQGVDYRAVSIKVVDTSNELAALQKVADIEVFYWYGCEPCRQVEVQLAEFLNKNPQYSLRRTPLVAHPDWRQQAYIQPLGEQLAKQINFPDSQFIYQTCINDCSVLANFNAIKDWLKQQTQLTDLPRINESLVWQAEKDYRKRAESFVISQVPTIIIRESFAVDANSAKSAARFQQIIEHLLTLPTL